MKDCIEYWGGVSKSGRPTMGINGKTINLSRLVYRIFNGSLIPGMFVCHTCDNPKCINPKHLKLGTVQDNSNDMVERGRSLIGRKHWNNKLTEKQVLEIRNFSGDYTDTSIAKQYNVCRETVRRIRKRINWSHL